MSKFDFKNEATGVYKSTNLLPRHKFEFKIEIHFGTLGKSAVLELERVADVQMPGHSINTQILNQYNKKRIVQTGIEYTPVSLTAYDTRDALIENFLKGYNEYYHSGPMSDLEDVMKDDIIDNRTSPKDGISDKGFNLTDRRYYISKIRIIRTSSVEDKNIIEIYNPIITSIRGDTLSYAESGPVQYNIEFAYEGYTTVTNPEKPSPTLVPDKNNKDNTLPGQGPAAMYAYDTDGSPSNGSSPLSSKSNKGSAQVQTEIIAVSDALLAAAARADRVAELERSLRQENADVLALNAIHEAERDFAFNTLLANYSAWDFAGNLGPVPVQDATGRWYAEIKNLQPNAKRGSSKIYVDDLVNIKRLTAQEDATNLAAYNLANGPYNAAYTRLNEHFSPGDFAGNGGPIPYQDQDLYGRWYGLITDLSAPNNVRKVYVDEL